MAYIMVDVEADGPIPGDYSMIAFGAVKVEPELKKTFYGRIKPISDAWIPEVLWLWRTRKPTDRQKAIEGDGWFSRAGLSHHDRDCRSLIIDKVLI